MASESSEKQLYPNFFDSSTGERKPLHDVLNEHINGCQNCQETSQRKPNGLGQISRLCFKYQDLVQDWAELEGLVNNIVAHDEYGNEAPRNGDPRKDMPRWA